MNSSVRKCVVRRIDNGKSRVETDLVATEEPLEIQLSFERGKQRVNRTVSVTMRTPGNDAELAAGLLFAEGILQDVEQIDRIETSDENRVRLALKPGITVDLRRLERNFYTSSSCGVCGKTSLEQLQFDRPALHAESPSLFVNAEVIHQLPNALKSAQTLFSSTGGLHAAALFDPEGNLVDIREDVGRHNAVDKLIGAQLLAHQKPPFANRVLFLSGRAGFELIQKAVTAGIRIVAAVGAPSSLAVEMAQINGITLAGFVRNRRFNLYCDPERLNI
ncbi:MAG TPA: formate dehydrogenase accessory sulfurtransferase FdhD [Chthoniobacterales bacterium]